MGNSDSIKDSKNLSRVFSAFRATHLSTWFKDRRYGLAGFIAFVAAFSGLWSWQIASSGAVLSSQHTGSINVSNEEHSGAITLNASSSEGSASASTDGKGKASVSVNGQTVQLNSDGTVHKVIKSDGGKTTVDIEISNNTNGNHSSISSSNVNVRSSSYSDIQSNSQEGQ